MTNWQNLYCDSIKIIKLLYYFICIQMTAFPKDYILYTCTVLTVQCTHMTMFTQSTLSTLVLYIKQ